MRLWFLDNEYTDYVVMAETEDDAWEKLNQECGILRPDEEGTEDEHPAYNELVQVLDGFSVDNPHDLKFVI